MNKLVRFVEKLLGIKEHGDSPRADLMLPNTVLYIGVGVIVVGIGCLIFTIADYDVAKLIASVITIFAGIYSLLWWKNTTITILSTHEFEYKTLTKKAKVYRFDEITGYDKSYNFFNIYLGKEKVHIDETALMTQRLRTLFNKALNKEVFK